MKDYSAIEQRLQNSYDGLLSAAKAPDIKIDPDAKISRRESVSEFFGRPGMQIAAAALAVIFTVGGIYSFIFYFGSKNPGKKPIPAVSDTETAVGTDEEIGGYTTDELTETEEEISDMTAQETTEAEEPSNTGTETGEENTETEEEKTKPETEAEELTESSTEAEELTEPPTEAEELTEPPTEAEELTEPPTETEELTEPPTEAEELTEPPTEAEELTEPLTEDEETTEPEMTEPSTETEEITEPYFPYDIYLPQNLDDIFEKGDNVTPRYNGENLFKYKVIIKKDVPDITMELFGYERDMYFSKTEVHYAYGVTLDSYFSKNTSEYVEINRKTGKIVKYSCFSHTKDLYDSPVNAHSSREEFIQYARDLLLEYTGVSTEGCEAIVSTVAIGTTYKYTKEELNTDFVNFIEYDPDFSARYEIKFQKKIGCVNHADPMRVEIRSDGTVSLIYGIDLDDEYAPFADVKIDTDSITRYIEDRIDEIKKKFGITSYNITFMAIPLDGNLWIRAEVYSIIRTYDGQSLESTAEYLILVKGDFENPDYLIGDYNMYVDYEYDYEVVDPEETCWE
jgi:hypothetical protein